MHESVMREWDEAASHLGVSYDEPDAPLDDIERADLDAATRADERLDEDDTDYDGPDWPF